MTRPTCTDREIRFDRPALTGWSWPLIEIDSGRPGPRLCLMAGMHPNEVSSMEAALVLRDLFAERLVAGRVEILPVVNMPGVWEHAEFVCPIDGKNINFSFPGNPEGSFSEALADALLQDWAKGADVVVDLHGGDLTELVAQFTMIQLTGDAAHDARLQGFARCFDADIWVDFTAGQTANAGRATNQSRAGGPILVMSEAGDGGYIDAASVAFHVNGVTNVALKLGMIEGEAIAPQKASVTVSGFDRAVCPENGRFYHLVEVGDAISKGQKIGILKDLYGHVIHEFFAPADGHVVFRVTHNIVRKGEWVLASGA